MNYTAFLTVILIGLILIGIYQWLKGHRVDKFIISPWQDHSMRLGRDFYRVRWILRLGKIYNKLDYWNEVMFWGEGETHKMFKIRKIIELYSVALSNETKEK